MAEPPPMAADPAEAMAPVEMAEAEMAAPDDMAPPPDMAAPQDLLAHEAMADNSLTGRIRRVEAAVAQIQHEFDALRPAILRLVAIEADLDELIAQLFRLVAPPPPSERAAAPAMSPAMPPAAPPAANRAAAGAPVMLLPGAGGAPQAVAAPPPPAQPAAATADAFSLHLASYRRQQDAVDGWAALRAQAPGVLSGLMPGTSRFTRGADGEFIRLKAGPIPTRSEANALCAQLRAGGLYCEVQPYAGTVPF